VTHITQTATFLYLLGVVAVVGMGCGTALAVTGYSSAGAFSIAAACVGVLGTLASQNIANHREPDHEPDAEP
jgi:hypothetical protein